MNRFTGAIFFSAALAVVAAQPAQSLEGVDVSSHPWIGNAAPGFELARIDGVTLSLEQLKGKYVVIHFGASW
jgi:cytochrome oxidase Cu insertion factor (SCO1/SenC/PrrC family)